MGHMSRDTTVVSFEVHFYFYIRITTSAVYLQVEMIRLEEACVDTLSYPHRPNKIKLKLEHSYIFT